MKVWTSVTTPTPAWHGGDVVQPVGHLSATLRASARLVAAISGATGGTTLFGATQPGVPEETPSTRTNIVRCYNPSDLASTNPGDAVAYAATSFAKAGTRFPDLLGNNGAAAQTTAVNSLIAYWSDLRDEVDQYADLFHEPDNGNGPGTTDSAGGLTLTGARIVAAMNVVIARVKPALNNGGTFGGVTYPARTHPIKFGITFTGQFFASLSANDGSPAAGWISNNWGWLGADIYYQTATARNAASLATSNGIPIWLHPEVGTQVQTNPPDTGVGSHLAHMTALKTFWDGMAFPPRGCCWFEQNHNRLWTRLASAAGATDTSIVVRGIPGKASNPPRVTDWSMANGATIIIDPHSTSNPAETRSLSSLVQHAGDVATTLPFAGGLAHSHAAGTVVWLMPSSIDYWRRLS